MVAAKAWQAWAWVEPRPRTITQYVFDLIVNGLKRVEFRALCARGHVFCSRSKCIWFTALKLCDLSGPRKVEVAANALLVLRVGSLAWGSYLSGPLQGSSTFFPLRARCAHGRGWFGLVIVIFWLLMRGCSHGFSFLMKSLEEAATSEGRTSTWWPRYWVGNSRVGVAGLGVWSLQGSLSGCAVDGNTNI